MNLTIRTYAPSFATGLLLALAFPAFSLFFLAWIALVPLLLATASKSPREAALSFFLSGWVFHSITLQWLMSNIMWAGGVAVLGYQFLCLSLALFWAALGYVWAAARHRNPTIAGAACFAGLWALLEAVHSHLFTGFGWSVLAYSQGPDLPLLQWASIGGTPLIGFLIALVNALIALALKQRRLRVPRLVAALLILALTHAGGYAMLAPAEQASPPFRAGIVQTDYAQDMKWDREYTFEMIDNAVAKSYALAQNEKLNLVVWPEATVMTDINNPRAAERIRALAQDIEAAVFTGTVRYEGSANYNSSALFAADGTLAGHYDKIHLAPFGEYVPMADWLPFLRAVVPGEMSSGTEARVFSVDGRRLGALICFEVLFAPMSEQLRAQGADFIVVVTNLGWFGASNALAQELDMARLRAIETRLPLVQAANTGISGVFDPWGRFTPMNAYVTLEGQYVRRNGDPLPPTATRLQRLADVFDVPAAGQRLWDAGPRIIPWLLWLSALVLTGAAIVVRRSGDAPAA